MPTVPIPGLASKAAQTRRAKATSSAVGRKPSLMAATCAGWMAILPVKPSRRAAAQAARRAASSRKSGSSVSIGWAPAAGGSADYPISVSTDNLPRCRSNQSAESVASILVH